MCLAVPTQIKSIDEKRMATVELGGVERKVSLIMTPEAGVGDYVLVHVGFALSRVDEEDALQTLADLQQMVKFG